jgi:carboxypeptidase D
MRQAQPPASPVESADNLIPTTPRTPMAGDGGNSGSGNGSGGGPTDAPGSTPPPRPTIRIVSCSTEELVAKVRFPAVEIKPVTYHGRAAVTVAMPGCQPLKSPNAPALPVQRWDLILPTGAAGTVEIAALDTYTVPSDPPVPSGGFGRRTKAPPEGSFGTAYTGAAPYPSETATLSPTYRVRSIEAAGVVLHPVRYLPDTQSLEIARSAQIRIRYASPQGKALRYPTPPASRAFRQLAAGRYANYTETVAETAVATATRTDGSFTGTDTMLVIMPDAWDGLFDDFLQWKRERGLRVLTALYPSETGAGAAGVASYIQNAYDTQSIAYVLLLGDNDDIPISSGNQEGGTPSDTVYTLVAGDDDYHDILLSRVCAGTATNVGVLLDKYRAYERTPDTTEGWHAAAMMVASDQKNSFSDDTVYGGRTDAEDLELFGTDLVANGPFDSFDRVYEGTTEGKTAKISTYWNAGRGLIYYLGHGSNTSWTSVTFSTANAGALANGTRLPYVVNGACANGAFQKIDLCLAEAMLWGSTAPATNGEGGAIAIVASTTDMSWTPPIAMLDAFNGYYMGQSSFQVGSYLPVSGEAEIWDAGGLAFASIQRAMDYCLAASEGQNELELIMQQTHLFGDCTLGIRTVTPQALVVVHDAEVRADDDNFAISVSDAADQAVEGATVTLLDTQGNEVVGVTDSNGQAVLSGIGFAVGDEAKLTVYERNSVPYQASGLPVVPAAPVIRTDETLAVGYVGSAYSLALATEGGTEPYSYSMTSGFLPSGVSFSTAGLISGTPRVDGDYSFTVRVTDTAAEGNDKTFAWTVLPRLSIADTTMEGAVQGVPYSTQLLAEGGATDGYTWTLETGSLPPGITLATDGMVAGTPSATGTYAFTVRVSDTAGHFDTASLSLDVTVPAAPDTSGDGDVNNQELLSYISLFYDGKLNQSHVEQALADWRSLPAATRTATTNATGETRTRVVVDFGTKEVFQQIIDRGLIVDAVEGTVAWLYVNDSERAWLESLGLVCLDASQPTTRSTTTYDELVTDLETLVAAYPGLCRLVEIGVSTQGRSILALAISDHPREEEDEPEVRVVGGIHGDERLGARLPGVLAEWLLANYGGSDADGLRATALVNDLEIWILPVFNPDGYVADRRENANGKDLNRSFPDGFLDGVGSVYEEGAPDTAGRQPETAAMMSWTASRRFSLSAHLHTGALLVCYPYGNNESSSWTYSASPDDSLFIDLGHTYVDNHPTMGTSGTVAEGLINSSAWYPVVGELADWAYRYTGTLDLTMELDRSDDPDLAQAWDANKESLLSFLAYARKGIRGTVVDSLTGAPVAAAVEIAGNERAVYTDPDAGDYHRLLLPGTYDLTVSANGYLPRTVTGIVVTSGDAARVDIELVPAASRHTATRDFATVLFEPSATNTVGIIVDIDEEAVPDAFVVSEVLPDGWAYVEDSAMDTESGEPLDAPRLEGNTISWVFWGDQVVDRQFTYAVSAPAADSASFGGSFQTDGDATATGGDATWLAHTPNREAIVLSPGWNLFSVPITPDDPTPSGLFGTTDTPIVWQWNAAVGRYSTPGEVVAKQGYWLYSNHVREVIVEGSAPSDDDWQFAPGWNLFGPLADRALLSEPFLDSGTLEWSGTAYQCADALRRASGYWIHASQTGRTALR